MNKIRLDRRKALAAGAWLAFPALGLVPTAASAEGFPDRPLKLIVPWPAGGVTDAAGRLLAQRLADRLQVPVVVDNRPGANGRIGAELAAKSPADGYTLFLATAETHAINPSVFARVPYDPLKDFVAVAPFAINPFTIVAKSSLPAATMKEMVALAKARPGSLTSASWGVGSTSQIILEMVKSQAGIDILHVPFQGEAPAVAALLGGQVDMMVMPAARADQLRKDGRVKVLAVTTAKRFDLIADVPTLQEQGYNVDVANWFAVVAPGRTPVPVITRLNDEIRVLLDSADFQTALKVLGVGPHAPVSADSYQRFIASEGRRWSTVIAAAQIRLE